MKRQFSEYLDLLFASTTSPYARAAWRPAADVYRCEKGWLLKFDLAGVRQEDIEVRIQGRSVVVAGTRRDSRVYQHQLAHRMEISYSRFERTVELPEEISHADVRTEYRDGMLLVHVLARGEADS